MEDAVVRWMIRRDLDAVADIAERSFGSEAWSKKTLVDRLKERHTIGMVLDDDGDIRGFMIYELSKSKIKIIYFAVDPDHRRKGYGTMLIDRLKRRIDTLNRESICISIDEGSRYLDAHLFFVRMGFIGQLRPKSLRSNEECIDFYFDNPKEKAY